MRALLLTAALAVSLDSWWRPSNSHASSEKGVQSWEENQHAAAVSSFATAQEIDPTPLGAFNLGTAQIAAGELEEGSATMEEAIRDPSLRAAALYNRGNAALSAKAYDRAVRDYIQTLRLEPGNAAAKRNLEIALMRQRQQQQQAGGQQNQQGSQQQDQQPQQPAPGEEEPKPGEIDMEALLRSVQQQEQEELRRMKGRPAEARVGW
jgi:tetratricopeptide (TPR) repeat protein